MDNQELKSFLSDHRDDLIKRNYDNIYESMYRRDRKDLTAFLVNKAGRNPLEYMSKIYEGMFSGISFKNFKIPSNISSTNTSVENLSCEALEIEPPLNGILGLKFENCSIKKVIIDEGVSRLKSGSFDSDNSIEMIKLPSSLKKIDPNAISCDSIVATNKRDANSRLVISKSDVDFYKSHLKYFRAKQVEEPTEEEE